MVAVQHFLADRFPVLALAASATPDGGWFDDVRAWFVQHWEEFTLWASQRRENQFIRFIATSVSWVESTLIT